MRRHLGLFSVAVIIGTLLWALLRLAPPLGEGQQLPASWATAVEEGRPPNPESPPASKAMEVGQTVPVDLLMDHSTRSRQTAREKLDQFRDWLLFAVVSQLGLSADEVNRTLFDLPTLRHGHVRAVGQFEYGETRSCLLGSRRVLALVPRASEAARKDHLAHIADEHRKNLGVKPSKLLVFEYELRPQQMLGSLKRLPDLDGDLLFTPAYGYYETQIRHRTGHEKQTRALQDFMQKSKSLTYAQVNGQGLLLGGRKYQGWDYRGLRVEDVAAIWQAQYELKTKRDTFFERWQREHDEIKRRWNGRLAALKAKYQGHLITFLDQMEFDRQASEIQNGFTEAEKALAQEQNAEASKHHLPDHTGFSLDPTEELGPNGQAFKFQKARYDGNLKGTEVGMVLFYTDLLAKLWAGLNYEGCAPSEMITDFRSAAKGGIPALYAREFDQFPNARLWFGPEERSYQITSNRGGILFAPVATRLFSKSKASSDSKDEVAPSQAVAVALDWWNDHYEEVARYEQEYERLNEYIKWSAAIVWLQSENRLGQLSFLEKVDVDRNAWFPDWVQKRELRFRDWGKIKFFRRGTEALPLLESALFWNFGGRRMQLAGGVSGARPSTLKERAVLPERLPEGIRRSLRGIDPRHIDPSGNSLRSLRGTAYEFKPVSPRKAEVLARPKEGQALRATHGDLAPTEFRRVVSQEGERTTFRTSASVAELGELTVSARGNGFRVEHRARDIDAGQSLAREVSSSPDPDPRATLMAHAQVEACVGVERGGFLVKLRGSEKWLKLAPEIDPLPTIKDGWSGRVGDPSAGAKTYLVAWVEAPAVVAEMGRGDYLRIRLGPMRDGRAATPYMTRGPPAEGAGRRQAIEIHVGGKLVKAEFDPQARTLYLREADLPGSLRNSPADLAGLFRSADLKPLSGGGGSVSGPPQGPPRISLGSEPPEKRPLIRALLAGDLRKENRLRAVDREGAHRQMQADRAERLDLVDRQLNQNLPVEALQELEVALRLHPGDSALLLRRGIALLRLRRPQGVRQTLGKHQNDPARILSDVNRILREGPSSEVREAASRVAREGVARDMKRRNKTTADVQLVNGSPGLLLEAQLPREPTTRPARPQDVQPCSELYIDDSRSLGNRDFSPTGRQKTIQQAIEGGECELVRLHQPDHVFQINPDVVRIKGRDSGWHNRPSTPARVPAAAAGSLPWLLRPTNPNPTYLRLYYLPRDDDEEEEEYHEVEENPHNKPDATKPKRKVKRRSVFVLKKKATAGRDRQNP